ncbi:MAG TPA: ATPase [Nitrospiraceae bacterium]|nr:ATPase [Nitrospiraceae bacterium]
MSKIEIAGEKTLLQDVLSLLRELKIFQIEPAAIASIEAGREEDIRSFALDDETVLERLFLEDLRLRIEDLFSCLPKVPVRQSYLDPLSIVDIMAKTVRKHGTQATALWEDRDRLQKEERELGPYTVFLGTLLSLLRGAKETPDLDFIGLTIREPAMVGQLREAISRITDWKFELLTETAEDGTLVGLITVEKESAEGVKKALSDEHVPELTFPPSFQGLAFPEKLAYVETRRSAIARELRDIEAEREQLSRRWVPIYRSVGDWIDDRLSLLNTTTACAFETRMCFFIHGWMPTRDVAALGSSLSNTFGEAVALEEQEIREEDLERVPIALKNPPYFRPFELFTRLLPLPAYRSYDPTPFIAIFFPIFFGMILGDAGYGLVLVILALFLKKRFLHKTVVREGATILFIASLYTVFFGILYGEFFGDLPHRLFGLEPICIERRTAVIPMIFFALAVGVVHVLLGFFLGVLTAFRKKTAKEAVYKALSIVIILCVIAVVASLFGVFPTLLARPVIIAILFLAPLLFFAGGVLAPLELLKSIGNIISYVRIAAIGLTSVLLAFVANRLAGLTGDIVIGIVVAGLLHLLNIILGVFSPTIHALRLHYVEFFSKFVEHGGRKFEPMKTKNKTA